MKAPPEKTYQARLAMPFGVLGIMIRGGALKGIDFLPAGTPELAPQDALAEKVCAQLRAYLVDPAFVFDLPLDAAGTPFRSRVWQALQRIPSGKTLSYGELAHQLHSAPRAIGQACGANPIPLIIPCHRVLSSNGLGGFMNSVDDGSLSIKRWLLQHESGRP